MTAPWSRRPQVENPIAFLPSPLSRTVATLQLHWRYVSLLLWPQHLSADWSFECVPIVERLADGRNLAPAVLYLLGLTVVLQARPWSLPWEWVAAAAAGSTAGHLGSETPPATPGSETRAVVLGSGTRYWGAPSAALALRRWRAFVVLGLMAAPFLPSSNLLFFVGTYIGERLLYLPSVGYCLLLGEALAALLSLGVVLNLGAKPCMAADGVCDSGSDSGSGSGSGKQHRTEQQAQPSPAAAKGARGSAPSPKGATTPPTATAPITPPAHSSGLSSRQRLVGGGGRWRRRLGRWLRLPVLLACVIVLALYAERTYRRNWDWLSEETLFLSAQKVR